MERVQVEFAMFNAYRFKRNLFGKEFFRYQPIDVRFDDPEVDYLEVDRTEGELHIHFVNGEVEVYTDVIWYKPVQSADEKISFKRMLVLYEGGKRIFDEEVMSLDDVVEVINANWDVFKENKQEAKIEIRNL